MRQGSSRLSRQKEKYEELTPTVAYYSNVMSKKSCPNVYSDSPCKNGQTSRTFWQDQDPVNLIPDEWGRGSGGFDLDVALLV